MSEEGWTGAWAPARGRQTLVTAGMSRTLAGISRCPLTVRSDSSDASNGASPPHLLASCADQPTPPGWGGALLRAVGRNVLLHGRRRLDHTGHCPLRVLPWCATGTPFAPHTRSCLVVRSEGGCVTRLTAQSRVRWWGAASPFVPAGMCPDGSIRPLRERAARICHLSARGSVPRLLALKDSLGTGCMIMTLRV